MILLTSITSINLIFKNVYSSPVPICNWFDLLLLSCYRNSLYILDINLLSDVICKYFLPFCGLSFHSVLWYMFAFFKPVFAVTFLLPLTPYWCSSQHPRTQVQNPSLSPQAEAQVGAVRAGQPGPQAGATPRAVGGVFQAHAPWGPRPAIAASQWVKDVSVAPPNQTFSCLLPV